MKHLGIEVSVKHVPELDPGFLPLGKFNAAFLKDAKQPLDVAVERAGGEVAVYKTFIHGTPEMAEADVYYVDRLIKMLLWMKGGFKVYLSGSKAVYEAMKATYCVGGKRAFDADFMSNVYEKPFEVVYCDAVPAEKSNPQAVGRHLGGCRIGFDAGGSDRKVSAVIDGEPVFSEEVVWFPKTTADPDYHYEGIVSALKSAAAHMPRVDAVGVSSAGIYIENRTMVASLFLKVPKDLFDAKVKDIYIRAAKEIGDVPLVVCNDGDVTALAGGMLFGTWVSFLLTWGAVVLGSVVVFLLARSLGQPFVDRMVSHSVAQRYLDVVRRKQDVFLILAFLFPFFPDDLICILAGLSDIPFRRFLIIALLTRPWGLLAASAWGGSALSIPLPVMIPLVLVGVAVFLICLKYGDRWENKLLERFKK